MVLCNCTGMKVRNYVICRKNRIERTSKWIGFLIRSVLCPFLNNEMFLQSTCIKAISVQTGLHVALEVTHAWYVKQPVTLITRWLGFIFNFGLLLVDYHINSNVILIQLESTNE